MEQLTPCVNTGMLGEGEPGAEFVQICEGLGLGPSRKEDSRNCPQLVDSSRHQGWSAGGAGGESILTSYGNSRLCGTGGSSWLQLVPGAPLAPPPGLGLREPADRERMQGSLSAISSEVRQNACCDHCAAQ